MARKMSQWVINEIRRRQRIEECISDEDIERGYRGTLLEANIEIEPHLENLKRDIEKALETSWLPRLVFWIAKMLPAPQPPQQEGEQG